MKTFTFNRFGSGSTAWGAKAAEPNECVIVAKVQLVTSFAFVSNFFLAYRTKPLQAQGNSQALVCSYERAM